MGKAKYLDTSELARALDGVPNNVKWDIVQLACDLLGIVYPQADAASAFISLVRGDLLGVVTGVISIFPIGDVVKLANYQRYRRSVEALVAMARRNYRLARAMESAMRELNRALNSIGGFMGQQSQSIFAEFVQNLDGIRAAVRQYLDRVRDINRFGVGRVARKAGRSGGQFVGHGDEVISVNRVVDLLEDATGRNTVRDQAEEMLGLMAMSDRWLVTAGRHASDSDATKHITVLIDGIDGQFHIRVDKRGHLFEITHGPRGEPILP